MVRCLKLTPLHTAPITKAKIKMTFLFCLIQLKSYQLQIKIRAVMPCKKHLLFLLTSYLQLTISDLYSFEDYISDVEMWDSFIEKKHQQLEGKSLEPFSAVIVLVRDYLLANRFPKSCFGHRLRIRKKCYLPDRSRPSRSTTRHCSQGHFYTQENLRKLNLDYGIADTCNTAIELLDSQYGPFKAVVGTYTFSFIHPEIFHQVMRDNVLSKIEVGGYFAGGFLGRSTRGLIILNSPS